jgi:hypothetical protein
VASQAATDHRVAEPSLHVSAAGPAGVTPGRPADLRVAVAETAPPKRMALRSGRIHLGMAAAGRSVYHRLIPALGPGESRLLPISVPIPATVHGRLCLTLRASAKHDHGATARRCEAVAR